MKEIAKVIGIVGVAFMGLVGVLLVFCLFGGTILYFAWPVVMVEVFKLPTLTWWQAVCLSYVAHTLIKPINTSSK